MAAATAPAAGRAKDCDALVKLLLIGDSGVGKSCLLLRFAEDAFTTSFITTIGIDFKVKKLLLDGRWVKCQVWDTAGQERFRTITAAYYRGAAAVLLVYDVGDAASFANVRGWMKAIDAHAVEGVVKAIVGNKADLPPSARAVSREEGAALAREYGVPFFEASAKTGAGVDDAFTHVAREVVARAAAAPGGAWPPASAGGGGVRLSSGGGGAAARAKAACCGS